MTKFSIITPVYNTEKYLDKCISSVLEQKFSDFEMLLINDGSTDKSLEILKKYSIKDNRIKIFDKKNEGQGAARNFALQHAYGKYILYLDSDDWILDDALQKLYDKFQEDNYDIIFFNVKRFYEETSKTDEYLFNSQFLKKFKEKVFSPNEANEILFTTNGLPFKAYNREFLINNNIKYSDTKYVEDSEFYFKAITCAKKMVCLDDFIVTYRIRKDSSRASTHLNIDAIKYAFFVCEKIFKDYYKVNPSLDALKGFIINRFSQLYFHFTRCDKAYKAKYYKMFYNIVQYINKEYYSKNPSIKNESVMFEIILKSPNYTIFKLRRFLIFIKVHLSAYFV